MLTDLALAPLRAVDEAGLTHEAIRGVGTTVVGPGASKVTTWAYTAQPIPARLNPLSDAAPERAGAPASAKMYTLGLPVGTTVAAGDRWRVSGETSGEAWSRDVLVQREGFPRSHEIRRTCVVIDVKANPV